MSHKRLFPDDQRERLSREAMELASALIAQIVMVLQMPEPPGAAPQPGHAPARNRAAPDPARLRDELDARLQTLIRVLNNPEPEALRLLAQRTRLAAPARAPPRPAIPGFEPRVPKWQRTLAHLCRRALAARQKLIDTS